MLLNLWFQQVLSKTKSSKLVPVTTTVLYDGLLLEYDSLTLGIPQKSKMRSKKRKRSQPTQQNNANKQQ
jgi:hypothetical protein